MRLGKKIDSENEYNEYEFLQAKLTHLEQKYKILLVDLVEIKSSEDYQRMPPRDEWDNYFLESKKQLMEEYNQLVKKYTKP